MRTKVTLVLIFLNVALFFFIFKFERNWRTEAASLESRRRVLGPEAADIRTLQITSTAPGGLFTLVRTRDTWSLTEPLNWPANPHAANSIVQELQLLEHEASFAVAEAADNGQSLADFGLENPKLTLSFTSGDPTAAPDAPPPATTLRIGDTTPDGKRLYILSPGGNRVHVVNRSLVDSISIPLEQLRADTLLTVRVFEARSLSLHITSADSARGSAGVRVRILRDGQRWTFAAPHTARASKTAIELVINRLNALKAENFEPTPGPPVLPSSAPALRITLEGNNRQETLYLGGPVPAPNGNAEPAVSASRAITPTQPGAAPATPQYYAQLEGRSALFTVAIAPELLEVLRNAQETLREKRILEFDPAAVTAVTISAPIQPNQPPITLQRLEAPAGQPAGADTSWQVVHRTGEAQAPQTLPADPAAVRSLLDRLSLLTADTFKSDAPTTADLEDWGFNRPLREITLTFSGNTPSVVLRLGTDAARRVTYASVGTANEPGASIYTVDSGFVNELRLTPTVWRNRTIGEFVPATARISALKLTDLAEKKVLAEHTFNAAGEPTTPPRDLTAVTQIVAALRNLKAKQFVPGGFADKVFAAGEERPWRFQLDATIALPGGASAEQTRTRTLLLTERLGGAHQFAGSKELDVIFALEQPVVDALWSLAYGGRDPGPPARNAK